MARLSLSSPWVSFYHEVSTFFEKDPDVRVVYDEDENILNLYVDNASKAAALTELLPVEKAFGGVTMRINVIPANRVNAAKVASFKANNEPLGLVYEAALDGNEHLADIVHITGIFNNPMTYVIFKKEVVQYFNDSLGDFNGVCSTLMQNIANEIFEKREGIYFCTDIKDVKPTLTISSTPNLSAFSIK